jgi:hypothetical protein
MSKPAFLGFMLLATWYLNLGMNMLLRSHLLDRAFLEIEHSTRGVYRNFVNRYSRHIDVTMMEKGLYERRMPNLLCIYASISIIVSVVRYFFHV